MCNLYSITTNQAAIAALFRVVSLLPIGCIAAVGWPPCQKWIMAGEGFALRGQRPQRWGMSWGLLSGAVVLGTNKHSQTYHGEQDFEPIP
jgi:hypothetical protein